MKSEIEAWISNINDRPDVAAINIGLLQTEADYQAYLISSFEYDSEDDDRACNEDYVPKQKYLILPNSAALHWEQLQDQVIQIISEVLLSNSSNILTHVPVVTVGFDDAELIKVKR